MLFEMRRDCALMPRRRWSSQRFALVGGHTRLMFEQLDGEQILADECKCSKDPSLECPVDRHAIKARQQILELEPFECPVRG